MDLSQKDQALASSEVLRKLAAEHSQYAQRLESLVNKRFLTEEEKLEEVRLKKLKLKLKDEIAVLENSLRQGRTHVA
jgi:uncharacterized protein YdcH (DUF465 family)